MTRIARTIATVAGTTMAGMLLSGCLTGTPAEGDGAGLEDPGPDDDSCGVYAEALAQGAVEADVPGEVVGDEVSEWSEVAAYWSALQEPGDADEWSFPLRDAPGLTLNPWIRLRQSDMVLHAWPQVCAFYEGPGTPACFVGSNPATRPSAVAGGADQFGCCRAVHEYGYADVHMMLDDVWGDDSGTLHVTVDSAYPGCGGYWLMIAGDRPDDA